MRQRLDRESRTLLGRLRIWWTERLLWELVGGGLDLIEGPARGSRPVPQARAGRPGQGARPQRLADRTAGARGPSERGRGPRGGEDS